ncbi:50S ribosomal protein L21 [Candidatus Roizmanbacteria bacterium RIFCSPHIGHO2_01_FULL_39_12c]|uniref:Large ribosomal subunit protein bL21 n=1 Tax=Candidatus Roizmanbacteria bacterium RIFCSPHIGHO2_01_FULL_39_12c TaxID=1802031 RepID=A0A1F7GFS5_9BACT|nr:MAG: 50S ribosomal protein L21 [Candidatus Roizmanbacteria bacterium RIFCSPHIGHO2_01_FULL_39_12c]OGK48067.1 MAG: 50S ribosomal protein L21 [Candidatus Roizmanbacteria bacterium RIFCSPLOWO2_01_FULL_40_13]
MAKLAVIKTGGKQYLVKENDEIIVEKIESNGKKTVELDKLAEFDEEKINLKLGTPLLKEKIKAEILEQLKGDKLRVARFKAKVRYRKVKGFRARLTKIKITKI